MLVVRSHHGVWIGWPSWAVWRWAQRFPTDIGFRENADVWKKEVIG